MAWIQAHWLQLVGLGWSIDQVLKILAQLFPQYKILDNLADYLGKLLSSLSPFTKKEN
jgi:hypothetical protein